MRLRTLAILFSIMILLFTPLTAQASHIAYSLDEMIEKSDLIVIGKTADLTGEYQRNGITHSIWGINVDYYLKGNPRHSNIKVITPGTKHIGVSVAYDLGSVNDYNLLFLTKVEKDLYIPMSISGRVELEKTTYASYLTRKGFVNIQEVQKFIEDSTMHRPMANYLSITAGVLLVVIFIMLIMGSRRKRGMNN